MLPDPGQERLRSGLISHSGILTVVLIYAVFAGLWILLSDKLVQMLFSDPDQIILASLIKGWLFVAVTSVLLYGTIHRLMGNNPASEAIPAVSRPLVIPFILLLVVIFVFTGSGIFNSFIQHKETEVARLQAIADLKTRQIVDWLRERQGDADFVQTSDFFAEQYSRWQDSGDSLSGNRMQIRLEQLRKDRRLTAITVLNPEGKIVWRSDKAPLVIAPILQTAALSAMKERKVQRVGPYRGMGDHIRLDYIVPLTSIPGTAPLIVLHIDLADWLFQTLQTWPVPSASGETQLVRQEGDQVLFLNELRHQKDTAAKLRIPLATKNLLAAQILRGEILPGSPVEGLDYRDVPTMGVARSIEGTDWFLMAQVDQSELYNELAWDSAWIGFVGLLAIFISITGFYLLRQRQQLLLDQAVQQSQIERLNALSLLGAISDSSTDAIFAKDLEGRYILFNRAAGDFIGKPADEVLGRDDRSLFPAEQAEMLMASGRQVIAENCTLIQEEVLNTLKGERIFLATKGPLRDNDGKVIGIFGFSHDITERKQIEASIRESKAFKRAILDSINAHIAVLDNQGVIVDVNQPWLRFAEDNGPCPGEPAGNCGVGVNYLEICAQSAGPYSEGALEAREGILAVLDGRLPSFSLEYPCHSPTQQRWFIMTVTPLGSVGHGVVIAHSYITERKQAEAELQLWAQAFEQANFGLVIADARNNTFIAVNPAFARQRGYTQEELIGKPILMVYSADWVEEIKARIEALDISSHGVFEAEHVCKDGKRFPVLMDITVIKSADGKPLTRIAYALDITERKAAEASLRESEKRFHDIVNASADWVWEVDAQVRYTYVSDSVQDLLGYLPEEVLGKQPFDLMPPEEAKKVSAEFAAIAARREPFRDLDNINLHKDGSLRHVQTNGMPILDIDGKLLGYRGLDRDVTEMKKSEERLRISEERLQLALEATKDGLWDWDLRTGQAYLTPYYYDLTGYKPEDVKADFEFFKRTVHPDDLPHVLETLEAHIEGKTPACDYDYRLVTRSGEIRWMRGRGQVVERDAEGAPLRMIGTTSDISERKAAEEALQRQAEELAQRNEELERFNRAMVGREMDMIALKKRVNSLSLQQGRQPPYPLAFLDVPPAQPEKDELP